MQITGVMQAHTSKLQPTSFFLNNGGVQKYPDSWVNHTYRYWSPGYEVDFEVFPSFYVTPTSGVNPLAIFNENPYNRVAVARRPSPPGTNIRDIIYSALPYLPPDIIRYAVAKADAQQYSDTEDHIFVDKSFVGFHTEATGTITLTLPQASALHDVFSANTWPNNPCQPQTRLCQQQYAGDSSGGQLHLSLLPRHQRSVGGVGGAMRPALKAETLITGFCLCFDFH